MACVRADLATNCAGENGTLPSAEPCTTNVGHEILSSGWCGNSANWRKSFHSPGYLTLSGVHVGTSF